MKGLHPFFTIFLLLRVFQILPAQNAVEIVRRSDEHARGKTSVAEMTITTVRPKWTRSLEMKVWMKGNDFALLLVQAPAKDKGIAYLKRKNEVWNWIPSLERTIKLPPSMMSQSWMGTDFTNDDLVKEASAVDDYTHKILGTEKQLDRDCYKIEMIPKPEAAIVWSRVLVWIDKKDYLQLRTEFYDDSGDLVNTMIGSEIKTLGGRLLPTKMTMTPAEKKGCKTEIIYRNITYDQAINDSFFTTDNLSKVKS
jgi:outer membrane lipoprotein-sorting protein